MTGETAKHKWKNLRDSYMKYMKYLKGSTGSAKKYQNWPWAAHLEFLKDTVAPRPTTLNVSVSQTHDTSFTDEVCDQGESDSEIVTPPSQMPPPKRAHKRKEVTDDVATVIKYLENKINDKNQTKLDHIDNLFLSYAHTFKTFSARTQAVLKMEMSQLFGRAELNEVDDHNSRRSSPVFSTTSSWSDVNSNEAADNDTGNAIQALNYSNVYTDGYPKQADNDTVNAIRALNYSNVYTDSYPKQADNVTDSSIQQLKYSNIHTSANSENSLVLGSYLVHPQSTKDLYENVTMLIATQPKHKQ